MIGLGNPMLWILGLNAVLFVLVIVSLWRLGVANVNLEEAVRKISGELERLRGNVDHFRNETKNLTKDVEHVSHKLEKVSIKSTDISRPDQALGKQVNIAEQQRTVTAIANRIISAGLVAGSAVQASDVSAAMPPVPEFPDAGGVVADYNRLADDPRLVESFEQTWKPKQASIDGNMLKTDEHGKLWLVQLDPMHVAALPSGDVVRNWEKMYKQMNGSTAKSLLDEFYQLDAGTTLMVFDAALARLASPGTWAVVKKGRLGGV